MDHQEQKRTLPMPFICDDGAERPDTAPGALHQLKASPQTIHWGYFDASLAPVLKVRSGDLVQAETISPHSGDDPDLMFDTAIEALYNGVPIAERSPGPHIMTGPIFVED